MLKQPDRDIIPSDHAAAQLAMSDRSTVARKLRAVALEARTLADHDVPIGFRHPTCRYDHGWMARPTRSP